MSRSLPSFEHENAFSMFDSEEVAELQDQVANYWILVNLHVGIFSPPPTSY